MNRRNWFAGIFCTLLVMIIGLSSCSSPTSGGTGNTDIKSIKITNIVTTEIPAIRMRIGIFTQIPNNLESPPNPIAYNDFTYNGTDTELLLDLKVWSGGGARWKGNGQYYIAFFNFFDTGLGQSLTDLWIYTNGASLGVNLSGAAKYNISEALTSLSYNLFEYIDVP